MALQSTAVFSNSVAFEISRILKAVNNNENERMPRHIASLNCVETS
jgi:hypothetical protein